MAAPDRLRSWIDAAVAQLEAGDPWTFITTISRVHALLGPRGALADQLRGWHDDFCAGGKLDGAAAQQAALASIRAAPAGEGPGAGKRDPFTPKLIAEHCDCDKAIAEALKRGAFGTALAAAQYGPAYVLAWTDVPEELRPLLAIPLDLDDPIAPVDATARQAAIAAALAQAQPRWPHLHVELDRLDFGSAHAFARTYSVALGDASFAASRGKAKAAKATKAAKLPTPPDWDALAEQLFTASTTAIAAFARKHPRATVSQFFFDANPPHEPVLICFDTEANFTKVRAALAKAAHRDRAAKLTGPRAWRDARALLGRSVLDAAHDPGDFSHQGFAQVRLAGVEAYAGSPACPAAPDDGDDFVAGQLRLLCWRVLERLAAERAFAPLTVATPLHLGYVFHDEPPVVLRTL